jgi:hypothetical protein
MTLTKTPKIPIPQRTRMQLDRSATALRLMQGPAVIVRRDEAEITRLKAALKAAEEARDAALNAAAARAHREERVKTITLRVVDNRLAWAAKMGLTQRQPLVVMQTERIVTADVWQLPPNEE